MQEFGSSWDWFVKAALPVLQLLMTLVGSALGAGIGGWVAIRTTTKALEAAAERERMAREAALERELAARSHARKRERVEALRKHAERYLMLLMQVFAFEADTLAAITRWSDGRAPDGALEPENLRPPSELFAELHMIEMVHLPFLRGNAGDVADFTERFLDLNVGVLLARDRFPGAQINLGPEFRSAHQELAKTLASMIERASNTLRQEIQNIEAQLD